MSAGNSLTSTISSFAANERRIEGELPPPAGNQRKRKSALTFSVQDASAALPQNCQTTNWMVEGHHSCVNVTLVMEIAQS